MIKFAPRKVKLLNWGFLNFDTVKLYGKDQAVDTPMKFGRQPRQSKIGFTQDLYVTLPKGSAARLKPAIERKDPLVAPIERTPKLAL